MLLMLVMRQTKVLNNEFEEVFRNWIQSSVLQLRPRLLSSLVYVDSILVFLTCIVSQSQLLLLRARGMWHWLPLAFQALLPRDRDEHSGFWRDQMVCALGRLCNCD